MSPLRHAALMFRSSERTVLFLCTGEVRYSRNGHSVSTLMHVDTSLNLWIFLDIYGSTKEMKSIGKQNKIIHNFF